MTGTLPIDALTRKIAECPRGELVSGLIQGALDGRRIAAQRHRDIAVIAAAPPGE